MEYTDRGRRFELVQRREGATLVITAKGCINRIEVNRDVFLAIVGAFEAGRQDLAAELRGLLGVPNG